MRRRSNLLVAGVAGLVAGAMSMAAGEYVSVHSQADTEAGRPRARARGAAADAEGEHRELTAIYVGRGLDPALAEEVAEQLMAHDALGAHARDELGISADPAARVRSRRRSRRRSASPSAAALPLSGRRSGAGDDALMSASPERRCCSSRFWARWRRTRGGASVMAGAMRVTFWGALAMALTAGVGAWFGTLV